MILASVLLAAALDHGTVLRLEMPAPSLDQAKRDVRVYLPPSYSRPESAARRYPVLYLLHGWPGSEGNWFGSGHAAETADRLIDAGTIPELLIVCPDGAGRGLLGRSLYINSFDGRGRMEDFIAHDLVRWTDSTFRTVARPAGRGIAGLSDGGSGALNLTFRHPEVFGAASERTTSASLPKNSRIPAGREGRERSSWKKRKFFAGSGSIGRTSTAATFPVFPTIGSRTWLQPPGAAPASMTQSPGRTTFSARAICASL